MSDFLIYEQDGPVVTLTMNQPQRRNPLSGNSAIPEFLAAMDRINDDRRVRCVILTGNGPSFSSGGDLAVMQRQASDDMTEMEVRQDYRRGVQRMARRLWDLEVPVIAAINGHAIGAGLDLTCMCDIRIASEQAKFAVSFIKVGIVPGDGGAWLLPKVVGLSRAMELALTGDMFDARQALEWNLVSQVVPHEQLMGTARDMAGRITRHAPHGVRLTKRLFREAVRSSFETVLELSAVYQAVSHKTADHRESVNAFLEKRAPRFD
jgi:enoyl-CoA hydratase/carnithine racemase